jgi:hypothetical protein
MRVEVNFIKLPDFLQPCQSNGGQSKKKRQARRLVPPKTESKSCGNVEPERDTPGMSAPTCAMPTSIGSIKVELSIIRFWRARTSAIPRRTAIATQAQPITLTFRRGELQAFNTLANNSPAAPIGQKRKLRSWSWPRAIARKEFAVPERRSKNNSRQRPRPQAASRRRMPNRDPASRAPLVPNAYGRWKKSVATR